MTAAKEKDLHDLFLDQLKDMYFAEKQILKALRHIDFLPFRLLCACLASRVRRPAGGPLTMMYLLVPLVAVESPRIYDAPFVPRDSHSLPTIGDRPRR